MNFSGIPLHMGTVSTFTGMSLNAAPTALQFGFAFIASESEINYFWVRLGTVAGTDSLTKVTFELQADNSGVPSGTALKSYEVTGGWSANTQIQISPSWTSANMTVGARYWIVVKNTSVAPTVDYIQLARASAGYNPLMSATYNVLQQWGWRQYNGTNWTTVVLQHETTLTIKFASGTLFGLRAFNTIAYDAAWVMTTTRAIGVEFQSPAESTYLNLAGVALNLNNAPATKLNLYVNRQLVASSTHAAMGINTAQIVFLPLISKIPPGATVAIMTDAMTSTSSYAVGERFTNHADFLRLKSFNGTACRVKLDNGTTWTSDALNVPQFSLYLNHEKPFLPLPLNRRQFNSMR